MTATRGDERSLSLTLPRLSPSFFHCGVASVGRMKTTLVVFVVLLVAACGRVEVGSGGPTPGPTPSPLADQVVTGLQGFSASSAIVTTDQGIYETTDSGVTWTDISPSGHPALLTSFFLSAEQGWMVEGPGTQVTVFATSNAGQNWQSSSIPTPYPDGDGPASLFFINSTTGWLNVQAPTGAAFVNSDVYATNDGGSTWTVDAAETNVRGPVDFATKDAGWAVGDPSARSLYATTNGGAAWTTASLPSPGPGEQQAVGGPVFFSDSTGVVPELLTGGSSAALQVLRTEDGGATWVASAPLSLPAADYETGAPPTFDALSPQVWFTSTPTGLGETTDAGASWSTSVQPAVAGATLIDFVNAQDGWAVVDASSCPSGKSSCHDVSTVVTTTDGGTVWHRRP